MTTVCDTIRVVLRDVNGIAIEIRIRFESRCRSIFRVIGNQFHVWKEVARLAKADGKPPAISVYQNVTRAISSEFSDLT